MDTPTIVLNDAHLILFICEFLSRSICEPDTRTCYRLLSKIWYKSYCNPLWSRNCRYRRIKYKMEKYYNYCASHRHLLLPDGPLRTLYPKLMQEIYLDAWYRRCQNKSYHFYNYDEIQQALCYFQKYTEFKHNFSHICCNCSGITMKHKLT